MIAPLALSGPAAAATAPAPPTTAQRVSAIAGPSVVYVSVRWTGYVQRPTNIQIDGTLTTTAWMGPYTVTTACSGFVADATGYVVTAGHCVDNTSMTEGGKAAIINADIEHLRTTFNLNRHQLAIIRSAIEATGKVEGKTSGEPPQRVVTVYPTGLSNATGIVADTVDFRPLSEGDVALLKVPRTQLPVVSVAPTDPPTGTAVLLAGYAGSVAAMSDVPDVSFKAGETSSQQNIGGVPFTEVSAAAAAGMSGGPALDEQGRVVGTVSFKPGAEPSSGFNFITATSTIRSLLARNGVANTLTTSDRAYRAGLDAFFAGRYHDAVKEFDAVLAVQPQHAKALSFKQQAITNYPNEVESGGGGSMLFVIIGVAAVVVLAGVAGFFLMRRRRGGPPPTAVVPTPAPAPALPSEPTPLATVPARTGAKSAESAELAQTAQTAQTALSATVPAQAAPEAQIYCPNCGAAHPADAHFCESCGEKFKVLATASRGRLNGHRR